MGCVYLITSPSGKQYVGQTVYTAEERWRQHIWDALRGNSDTIFHKAIRKFGPDNFTHEVICDRIYDTGELNSAEIEAIAENGTLFPGGYNMTSGGDRVDHTPLVRRKMSRKLTKVWADPEYKTARLENTITDGYRRKIGAKSKRNWIDPDYRRKVVATMKANLATPEARAKRSSDVKRVLADPVKYKARCRQLTSALRASKDKVMIDGIPFASMKQVSEKTGVKAGTVRFRCREAKSGLFRWWHTIPNHNDPACDAVEECWAQMQFAKACPDHENVPDWAKANAPRHCDVPDGFWA